MALTVDSRRTGTILQIINDHLNDWTDFAGQDINIPVVYQTYTDDQSANDPATYPPEYDQKHWSYRGQAAMLATPETWQVALGSALTSNIKSSALTGYTNRSSGFSQNMLGAWDSAGATTGIVQRTLTITSEGNVGRTLELLARNPGTAVTYLGGASAAATTVSLPGGAAAGDLALVIADRNNATAPTLAAGWNDLGATQGGAAAYSQRVGWKVLTADDITAGNVGTWTNATHTLVVVYENALLVGVNSATGANSTTLTFPARSGLLGTSSIVRIRLGDGITAADRTIYRQVITDPTTAANWTSWTQLYTGDHFAVALELVYVAGSTTSYRVIHAKSDGIYINNVLEYTVTGVTRIKPVVFHPGKWRFQVVSQDTDDKRKFDWYNYYAGIAATATFGAANYRWYRYDQAAVAANHYETTSGVSVTPAAKPEFVVRAFAEGHPRSQIASEVLLTTYNLDTSVAGSYNDPIDNAFSVDYIKGPSGQAGYKWIENLTYVPDTGYALDGSGSGYYYLFYNEQHHDRPGNNLSNLLNPLFWARSYNLPAEKWCEPVAVGYSVWGFAGVAWFGAYVYAAGNGRVLRRSNAATTIDLSNYVIEGNYDLPRGSQPATTQITCANPDNVLGNQLGVLGTAEAGFTEYRANLQLGLRHPLDTAWTWKQDALWWASAFEKNNDNDTEHLIVHLGDVWHRLANPFREAIYLPGNFVWNDWEVGGDNDETKYHNDNFEFYRIDSGLSDGAKYLTTLGGDTLFAGWRGDNANVKATFNSPATSGRILFRYQDASNYYYAEWTGSQLRLGVVKDGTTTVLATGSGASINGFTLQVFYTWAHIVVFCTGVTPITHDLVNPEPFTGFVGFGAVSYTPFTVSAFEFTDFNLPTTTGRLIRKLVNHADPGVEPVIDNSETNSPQLDTVWGPQSDLNSPAKALQQLLSTDNLELVYLPNSAGTLIPTIDHFDAVAADVEYTLQNEIIHQDHVNDGKGRPNIVSVDGNENSWTEYDRADLLSRQRPVNLYVDAPELLTPGDVRKRAEREILDARRYNSPGGDVVWQPWLTRMQPYYWIDEQGQQFLTRIEGIHVSWNQSTEPFQRAALDMGAFIECPPETAPASYIARDTFQRTVASGWSSAQVGGSWTIT